MTGPGASIKKSMKCHPLLAGAGWLEKRQIYPFHFLHNAKTLSN